MKKFISRHFKESHNKWRACPPKFCETKVRRGFTIIELLTAVFILSTALVGALTLATSNLRNQGIGTSRLVAVNLAKEGVEFVRGFRDSNWLANQDWDIGLVSQTSTSCAVIESAMTAFTFVSDAICQGEITDAAYQMYRTSAGRYYQGGTESTEKVANMFRKIRLQSICLAGDIESVQDENICPNDTQKIGVQVVSEVRWMYGDAPSSTNVIEKMYNWR
ncbi:prepilin-type N-terminal cleavage/methylation domain-containing protein [Candidatus Uhrbacteria bacterium]|nr:prepilin-type N-terminal cleavage/methylation domain-containing protein [Candidatus Uhrbacteria bacterium]